MHSVSARGRTKGELPHTDAKDPCCLFRTIATLPGPRLHRVPTANHILTPRRAPRRASRRQPLCWHKKRRPQALAMSSGVARFCKSVGSCLQGVFSHDSCFLHGPTICLPWVRFFFFAATVRARQGNSERVPRVLFTPKGTNFQKCPSRKTFLEPAIPGHF